MERWLAFSNGALVWSVMGLVFTVFLAYPYADAISLPWQILAHIGTLLFAVGIKISYVARLVFLSRLGRPIH